MRKFLRNAATVCLALGFATGASAQSDKGQRIKKLQMANRVYQVCLGRSLKPEESKSASTLSNNDLVKQLAHGSEALQVFGDRLATFAEGGETKDKLPLNPKLDHKLEDLLKVVGGTHHKGKLCGQSKANAICFAEWLVARVAPTLGQGWVEERQNVLSGWSYGRLLEEISASSLKED